MQSLAPYAVTEAISRGRCHPEPQSPVRGQFQRDRDRIIHATAFRRLEYKTQVFVNHEGDLFRTRLTHSIEVAQITRTLARALNLNEDLAEAIALAHDLGHTPFGHAGQDALNACMQSYGGFEHNLQSLRIVDVLEERYPGFNGINLMYETREGILKHCSPSKARELGELGERFLNNHRPSLEAQLANVADEIAYNNHDVDDGLRSGLITIEGLESTAIFKSNLDKVLIDWPQLSGRRLVNEVVRRMIHETAWDLITHSQTLIAEHAPQTLRDVYVLPRLIAHSSAMRTDLNELKSFLRKNLYQHYQVLRMTDKARRIISDLFNVFVADPRLLPPQYQLMAKIDTPRAVADYIAGMTDRYAMKEHRRLFAVGEIG